MGSDNPLTAALSTVTLITFSISGSSNIVFNKIFSSIDLNPLAPVFFEIAFFAIQIQTIFDIALLENSSVLLKFLLMIFHLNHLKLQL